MEKLNQFRNLFLPTSAYDNEESLRLHRFFIATCFVTSLFATIYFFMSIYIDGALFARAMVISFILFIFLPVLLRNGVKLSILVNVFLGTIALVIVALIYWEGGIRHANLAPWVIVLPSFAMMLQGYKAAFRWLTISLLIILGFSYFTFSGVTFPVMFDISKDPLFNLLSMSGLVCLITFIFFISEMERVKAHDGLEAQNVVLDKLNKEKSMFLQITAHDLRNPLIIIQELARLLSDPNTKDEEKTVYLNYIVASANRISELIKNLLEIQVLEAGKMAITPHTFSLTDMVNTYAAQMAQIISTNQMAIELDLPEKDISIYSDPARVEQILDNYVSNALKYSLTNTKIYVSIIENRSNIELAVKDEGPGIEKGELRRLFRQFGTVSSVPRKGEQATGLGLAIVKKVADALGAEVGCVSEKGKGSTFYARFPRAKVI